MSNDNTSVAKDATSDNSNNNSNSNNNTTNNSTTDLDFIRRANFDGKIPIQLTLAQTSLSSSVLPNPYFVLVSRQTFLHVGLEDAVRKLHDYALPTLSFLGTTTTKKVIQEDDDSDDDNDDEPTPTKHTSNANNTFATNDETNASKDKEESNATITTTTVKPYPVCWFEDVNTGQPLRWQHFVGVLYDSLHTHYQHKQQYHHQHSLPWKIRLHFRSYPSDKLLELCDRNHGQGVLETIRSVFSNSLKQAFVIRYGNSKEALNLSKQSHNAIWDGILSNKYDNVAQVIHRNDEWEEDETTPLPTTTTTTSTVGAVAAESSDETTSNGDDKTTTTATTTTPQETTTEIEEETANPLNNNDDKNGDNETTTTTTTTHSKRDDTKNSPTTSHQTKKKNNLVMLPVRLSVDPTKPMIQKRLEGGINLATGGGATLKSLFSEWAPSTVPCLDKDDDKQQQQQQQHNSNNNNNTVTWKVAGLQPPLSTPLLDLWLALKHPDNFLYISLSSISSSQNTTSSTPPPPKC